MSGCDFFFVDSRTGAAAAATSMAMSGRRGEMSCTKVLTCKSERLTTGSGHKGQ